LYEVSLRRDQIGMTPKCIIPDVVAGRQSCSYFGGIGGDTSLRHIPLSPDSYLQVQDVTNHCERCIAARRAPPIDEYYKD
jgi:hypothetical protein